MGQARYLDPSQLAPGTLALAAWAAPLISARQSVLGAGSALLRAIHEEFKQDGAASATRILPGERFATRHAVFHGAAPQTMTVSVEVARVESCAILIQV